MTTTPPIPTHFQQYDWYAPHQAYLRDLDHPHHDPGDAPSVQANLAGIALTFTDLCRARLNLLQAPGALLTNALLYRARLRGADLRGAIMIRAGLSHAELRSADLRGAKLAYADLSYADLSHADLRGVDLFDANLEGANLANARLDGANFSPVKLTGADLASTTGLPEAPLVPDLDTQIWASITSGGGLDMSTWHTCHTTHCRAGWAIDLAGEAGYALEEQIGSAAAGALIYWRSTGRIPDFYASKAAALEDIQKRAEQ